MSSPGTVVLTTANAKPERACYLRAVALNNILLNNER